ncbi:hypothetical protein Tco_0993066 [Tanacetum coccineum]|uniref:Transposase-associated domain-containing protein n=1 Tax=Tanacetum coccineum TaxID=301880 RepID=A0ABQ5F635_9ASTR
MSIDKTWIMPNLNHNTDEFKAGLNTFIEMCKAHLNDRNKCFCPCRRCENGTTHELSVIKKHIHDHGFSMYCNVWEYHGENFIIAPPIVDETNDMINVLNYICRQNTYIEHNTNTASTRQEGNDNTKKEICLIYKASRWKNKDTPRKKVPKKHMTWHASGKCNEDGKMGHLVDGKAWKDLTWPVILTSYNTLPWIRVKESSFMLTLLIPGPKSPGKDIDVYLKPLVEELKTLWKKPRVKTLDVATNIEFTIRAMLL